jgi:G:T-mismatch repair DNA endonuclease (very short patch repair protein)
VASAWPQLTFRLIQNKYGFLGKKDRNEYARDDKNTKQLKSLGWGGSKFWASEIESEVSKVADIVEAEWRRLKGERP